MSDSAADDWQVEVFYDGDCPLCVREIKMLRWMDRRKRIRFTNIADQSFRVGDYGWSMQEFMDEVQGRLADGTWIIGVEVFRRLYAAVGFGAVIWLTRVPGISHGLELGYRVFAKNRLKLTGRCNTGACQVS
ncbi:MAG: DUF393 domain-containing protein [Planctomycetota bacterium]